MSKLQVHTARITYGGPDRFDITWKSSEGDGKCFCPSGKLLGFGRSMRAQSERRRTAALETRSSEEQRARLEEVESFEQWAWLAYRSRYEEAMRISYKERRQVWDRLLARERVVLVCYCTDPERCHRRVLANILAKLGAVDCGELEAELQRPRRASHKPISGTLFSGKSKEGA